MKPEFKYGHGDIILYMIRTGTISQMSDIKWIFCLEKVQGHYTPFTQRHLWV